MNQALKKAFDGYFSRNDIFLRSWSEFNPEVPLFIHSQGVKYEIQKALRDAHAFRVVCKVTKPDGLSKSQTFRFSSQNSSYIKLIEKFGLSQQAKTMYKGLDVYDTHFSNQANLTTLRWNPTHKIEQIVAISDTGKDLIFDGVIVDDIPEVLGEFGIKVFKSHRKENEFVVIYQIEVNSEQIHCFKIIDNIDQMRSFDNINHAIDFLQKKENYWDIKHVY